MGALIIAKRVEVSTPDEATAERGPGASSEAQTSAGAADYGLAQI